MKAKDLRMVAADVERVRDGFTEALELFRMGLNQSAVQKEIEARRLADRVVLGLLGEADSEEKKDNKNEQREGKGIE